MLFPIDRSFLVDRSLYDLCCALRYNAPPRPPRRRRRSPTRPRRRRVLPCGSSLMSFLLLVNSFGSSGATRDDIGALRKSSAPSASPYNNGTAGKNGSLLFVPVSGVSLWLAILLGVAIGAITCWLTINGRPAAAAAAAPSSSQATSGSVGNNTIVELAHGDGNGAALVASPRHLFPSKRISLYKRTPHPPPPSDSQRWSDLSLSFDIFSGPWDALSPASALGDRVGPIRSTAGIATAKLRKVVPRYAEGRWC